MRNFLTILGIMTCLIAPLHADLLTYTVTPIAGQFFYQFRLTNSGNTGGTVYDLFLSVPTDIGNIATSAIGTPSGWGDPAGGLLFFGPGGIPNTSFVEWAADFSGQYDVGIGSSLSGFSFDSASFVGEPISFALNGATDLSLAQEVAPEPGTLTLLFLSVSSLCLRMRRRIY